MVGAPKITNETGTGWKQSKTVSITILPGYTTMYTLDGTDPSATNGTAVTGKIILTEPKIVKAVYVQADTGNESDMSTLSVTQIDNLPPLAPTLISNTMKEYAVLELQLKTSDDSRYSGRNSGVSEIRYKRPFSGTWTDWTKTSSSQTTLNVPIKFTEFEGKTVSIEIQLKDRAGNQSTKDHSLEVWPYNVYYRNEETILFTRTQYSTHNDLDYLTRFGSYYSAAFADYYDSTPNAEYVTYVNRIYLLSNVQDRSENINKDMELKQRVVWCVGKYSGTELRKRLEHSLSIGVSLDSLSGATNFMVERVLTW